MILTPVFESWGRFRFFFGRDVPNIAINLTWGVTHDPRIIRTARVAEVIMRRIAPRGLTFGVLLLAGISLLAPGWAKAQAQDQQVKPELPRLKAEVELLASPAFEGRAGRGGKKTADHLVEMFRSLRLAPLFDGSFVQEIPNQVSGGVHGRNVGARIEGSDPKLRKEWIILGVHFDHLGVRDGQLYPGADDNASGVAMMLEVARALAADPNACRRSIAFIGFDLEEIGLYGSRYFVEHSPIPLKQVGLFMTADMIGRALGGVCDPYVFVMGSEHAPGLRPWIDLAAKDRPVKVGTLGTDILVIDRSDYGPFRARGIPYLFFSTGENPKYHTPDDRPETIDYPKLEAISQLIHQFLLQALKAPSLPAWNSVPEHAIAEVATVRDLLQTLLDHRDRLEIGTAQSFLMNNTVRKLTAIVARGSITPSERSAMVNMARVIMVTVL